uniref:5' exonuclease Apollo n=1 Tax=Clastoptera arizonana TaxID=38151 RepID=A0A1B6DW08_9HEMI
MPGHILAGTTIAVDYWTQNSSKINFRFLTHVHPDCIEGLTEVCNDYIYTSPFNAWFLRRKLKINKKYIIPLSLNEVHEIEDKNSNTTFSVALIDSNHCFGSVMYLFQGVFGCILYTGHFRFKEDMLENEILKSISDNSPDVLTIYLDNTYDNLDFNFKSKEDILDDILCLIRSVNDKVLIVMHDLEYDYILEKIARDLGELVHVTKVPIYIGIPSVSSKSFTCHERQSRIYAVNIHKLNIQHIVEKQKAEGPMLTLILSVAHYTNPDMLPIESGQFGIHILPYSNHSSHVELHKFVSFLNPHFIIPVNKAKVKHTSHKLSTLTPVNFTGTTSKKALKFNHHDSSKFTFNQSVSDNFNSCNEIIPTLGTCGNILEENMQPSLEADVLKDTEYTNNFMFEYGSEIDSETSTYKCNADQGQNTESLDKCLSKKSEDYESSNDPYIESDKESETNTSKSTYSSEFDEDNVKERNLTSSKLCLEKNIFENSETTHTIQNGQPHSVKKQGCLNKHNLYEVEQEISGGICLKDLHAAAKKSKIKILISTNEKGEYLYGMKACNENTPAVLKAILSSNLNNANSSETLDSKVKSTLDSSFNLQKTFNDPDYVKMLQFWNDFDCEVLSSSLTS